MRGNAIDGLPIIDAKHPVVLKITEGDCARADRKEANDCVVARAIRRTLHAREVRVHLSRVYIRTNAGNWQRFSTPRNLRQEIVAFDRGGSFSPGEFKLTPVQPSARLTGKRTGGKNSGPYGGRKKTNPNYKPRDKMHILKDVRNGPFAY